MRSIFNIYVDVNFKMTIEMWIFSPTGTREQRKWRSLQVSWCFYYDSDYSLFSLIAFSKCWKQKCCDGRSYVLYIAFFAYLKLQDAENASWGPVSVTRQKYPIQCIWIVEYSSTNVNKSFWNWAFKDNIHLKCLFEQLEMIWCDWKWCEITVGQERHNSSASDWQQRVWFHSLLHSLGLKHSKFWATVMGTAKCCGRTCIAVQ
jgi:hypothetical protein